MKKIIGSGEWWAVVITSIVFLFVFVLACVDIPTEYEVKTVSYICVIDGDTISVFDGQPMHLDSIACAPISELEEDTTTVLPQGAGGPRVAVRP